MLGGCAVVEVVLDTVKGDSTVRIRVEIVLVVVVVVAVSVLW